MASVAACWGVAAGGDAVDGPLAEDELHDRLAPAGEGDGGGEVVGVAAAADEGGVADAAGGLGEGAAGGGGGGEVAVLVEGDGADGVVGVAWGRSGFGGDFGTSVGVSPLKVVSAPPAASLRWNCMRRSRSRGTMSSVLSMRRMPCWRGETLRSGADEVDVGALVEDEAGGLDGVLEALDAGDAAGAEVFAVHQQGVELDAAVAGEEGAAAGVEGVVVFHDGDGGFDGVDGGAAALERGPAGGEGVGDAALVGGDGVVGHGPGAAVDEEDGLWFGEDITTPEYRCWTLVCGVGWTLRLSIGLRAKFGLTCVAGRKKLVSASRNNRNSFPPQG